MTTPDFTDRLRSWSYRRQLLDRTDRGPLDVLRELVAVYSTHPTAPLSLLCRSTSITPSTILDLERQRQVVRIPGPRNSIFLAPAETAPRLFAAIRRPLESFSPSLRYAGIDPADYPALKERILAVTQQPATVKTLKQAIQTDGRLMTAVHVMAFEGLLLRIGSTLRTDTLSYVATDAWLGHPLPAADPDDSLQWLADAYLHAFGPARIADFAWWAGVPLRRARAAIALLDTVTIGNSHLLPADQTDAFATVEPLPPDTVTLVPKWDAYTMGHAPDGRQRVIPDKHLTKAFTLLGKPVPAGDALPLVLQAGCAVASWSHRFNGDRLLVTITPFCPQTPPPPCDPLFDEISHLFAASSVEIIES